MRIGRLTLMTLASLCALAGSLLLGSVTAQAYLTHPYLSQLTGFGNPAAVTVGPGGDLYVADSSSGGAQRAGLDVIDRFSSSGTPSSFSAPESYVKGSQLTGTPSGPFVKPQGVAVNNSTGEIYVSDGGRNVVDVFKASGEYLSQFTETTPGGTLNEPDGLAFDQSTDELYVTDPNNLAVYVFNSSGKYLSQFGNGVIPRRLAESVAVNDLTGNAYVSESEYSLIFAFNSLGAFLPPTWEGASTPAGSFSHGGGYTFVGLDQSSGHVYVAQTHQEVVDEFNASASEEYVAQVTGAATPADQFVFPEAVAVDPSSGDLYVADGGSGVVDVFGPLAVLPEVSTGAASSVGTTTATLEGVVNPDETSVTGCEFEYRTEAEATFAHTIACAQTLPLTGKAPVAVSANVTGLQVNTTYYYRLAATNANGTNYGAAQTLLTSGPPAVDSESSSGVGPSHVTLDAGIDPDGLATHYHFEYGPSASYGTSIPIPDGEIAAGFGEQAVSVGVTGLKPNTTYHYRVVASSEEGGTVDGADQTFTTLPPALIDSESVSSVADTSATLDAQINPLGTDTTAYVQYGTASCATSPASCADVPPPPGTDLGSGDSELPMSVHVQGLTPGTTYHYRFLVTNALVTNPPGVIEGPDETFTTQAASTAVALPDGRQWEMVTPPNKHGTSFLGVGSEEGEDIQAAADGGAITYSATAPSVANPAGSRTPELEQMFSTREAPGSWGTADIATPHNEGAIAGPRLGSIDEYKLFSSDLSLGLIEPVGDTPLPPLAAGSEKTIYFREANGAYKALVTSANVPPGTKFGGPYLGVAAAQFVSASPDLSHVVVTSSVALEAGAPSRQELYEWTDGRLQLASVLPGPRGEPALGEPGLGARGDGGSGNVRHAISNDGSRIVWEEPIKNGDPGGTLYLRDMARRETIRVDAAQEVPEPPGEPESKYWTANGEGSRVFFTSPKRLTKDSTAGSLPQDLYVFEVTSGTGEPLAGRLTDLTVDPGETANVQGVIGASEDGSYVYFVAGGVLGDAVHPGNNLYMEHYEEATKTWGAPTFIAALANGDAHTWSIVPQVEDLDEMTSRVSPNGRYLAFMSEASLTGYDNRDANSGMPDQEVFLYDASSGRLVCASCDPTGARPLGVTEPEKTIAPLWDGANLWTEKGVAANIPGWTPISIGTSLYQSRYLSDSGRLFFNSSDALVPSDVNGQVDVYEYEPLGVPGGEHACSPASTSGSVVYSPGADGCVGLISAGTSPQESAFLDASETGGDVFFLTTSKLSSQDYDQSYDIYDAHECTAASPCAPPAPLSRPPCTTGDACKAAPTPQPTLYGAPSSETFSGAGNVTPTPPAAGKPKAKSVKCKRGDVKRHGACVKKKPGRAVKSKKARKTNRRGR